MAKSEECGRGERPGAAGLRWDCLSPLSLKRLLPLMYAVVFAGFVGYSLMITVFTADDRMSNHDLPASGR